MMDKLNKKKEPALKEDIVQQQRERTANQWVPVADIDGNIVYRKDNILVGMLRVQPLKLDLLSDNEKKRKVEALAEELNGENEGLQIFCIGRPVDLNNYLEWLQDKAKQEQDYTRKRVLKAFIKEASNTASSGETVERRFYIIITKTVGNKAEEELTNRLRDLQHKLSSAELVSSICKDDESMDVYSLFAHPIQASFEKATIEMQLAPLLEI
jgi:hypothetical protein